MSDLRECPVCKVIYDPYLGFTMHAFGCTAIPTYTTPSPTLDEAAIVERCAVYADRIASAYKAGETGRNVAEIVAAAIRREGVTAVGEGRVGALSEITYNPVYRVTYEGADPTRGYVYRLATPTPNAAADALAKALTRVLNDMANARRDPETLRIARTALAQYGQQQPGGTK